MSISCVFDRDCKETVMEISERTELIKKICSDAGFLIVGIAGARELTEEKDHLEAWLHKGYHGEMDYMTRNLDLRLDPTKLVPNAKSIICLAYNYFRDVPQDNDTYKIAMYAQGKDYHKVLKKKLKQVWREIVELLGKDKENQARYFVDSAPILERQWAERAGLGWTGKNTLLINPKVGSYFFLAEIITTIDLIPNEKLIDDHCGTCTRCIDACPTDAIAPDGYLLKADQCISYFTIESKSDVTEHYKEKLDGWIFGCDICQQVCPWNKFSSTHDESEFQNKVDISNWSKDDWQRLSPEDFEENFSHTPLKRAGLEKIKKVML